MQIRKCSSHVILLALLGVAYSYPYFQQRIPNGEVVPHPCNPNHVWEGVGHIARGGGGERNSFGLDFDANGKMWSHELCMMDSDGDGRTNGQELGDPDCEWTPGTAPKLRAGLSHPGVCEPIDAPQCRSQASFVTCENLEFECDAIDQPDVMEFTARLPETPVPAQETTYMCMGFEFPQDREYHMVANKPLIDNINVMHHVVVYGCGAGSNKTVRPMNEPYDCFMSGKEGCNDIIGLWGVGLLGQCFYEEAGFLVGANPNGYQWAIMEMHWNNPGLESTWTDTSGMTFYLTPNLRPNNLGVLMIGQSYLEIPPGEEKYTATGRVSSDCTEQVMTNPVSIVSTLNHMHYLGSGAVTTLIYPGERSTYLAYDEKYNYDRPIFHTYDGKPVEMKPGDELEIQCHFKSTSRTLTTYQGEGTADEMCFGFIIYYPRENIKRKFLSSYMDVDPCALSESVIGGCDFEKLSDPTHPETQARYVAVMQNCAVGTCRKECKRVAKEVQAHPCFNGAPRAFQLSALESQQSIEYKYQVTRFWASLHSCDVELLRDRMIEDGSWTDSEASGAALMSHGALLITSAVLICTPIASWLGLL